MCPILVRYLNERKEHVLNELLLKQCTLDAVFIPIQFNDGAAIRVIMREDDLKSVQAIDGVKWACYDSMFYLLK